MGEHSVLYVDVCKCIRNRRPILIVQSARVKDRNAAAGKTDGCIRGTQCVYMIGMKPCDESSRQFVTG